MQEWLERIAAFINSVGSRQPGEMNAKKRLEMQVSELVGSHIVVEWMPRASSLLVSNVTFFFNTGSVAGRCCAGCNKQHSENIKIAAVTGFHMIRPSRRLSLMISVLCLQCGYICICMCRYVCVYIHVCMCWCGREIDAG